MILPDESRKHTDLVLLFRIDEPEQAEALHVYQAVCTRGGGGDNV